MGQPIDAHFGRPDGDYGLNRPLHPVNDARREIFGHAVLPLQGEAKIDRVETFGFQLVQPLDDFIGLSGDAITVDGTAYTVRVIQPEGTGVTTLVLERN